MTNKIIHKVMKAATYYKVDAMKRLKKLQKEFPNAAFKIEGKRKEYFVYQVWYEK